MAVISLGLLILIRGQVTLGKLWNPHVSPAGNLKTYFLYGVSFALGSVSCTIGPFLAATSGAIQGSLFSSLTIYVVYGLGFVVTIGALALLTAFSQEYLVRKIRSSGKLLERLSAGVLILVGAYLMYFGIYEISLQSSAHINQGFMNFIYKIQGEIVSAVSEALRALHLLN